MGDGLRVELERLWRGRVTDAKRRCEFAHKFLKEAQEVYRSGDCPECAKAISPESAARADHLRMPELFNALVLEGIVPDEREWRKAASDDERLV